MSRIAYQALSILFLSLLCASCASVRPVIVTKPIQLETAYHEAAHAVAQAAIFGNDSVEEVVVRSQCCTDESNGDLGHTVQAPIAMHESASALRGHMVVAFAGREMEIVANGEPTAGASSDIMMANMIAWHLSMTSGLLAEQRGSFMIMPIPMAMASPGMRAHVNAELNAADMIAYEFVKANESLIRKLAFDLLAQPERKHARTLTHDQFVAFMEGKKIVIPQPPKAEAEPEPVAPEHDAAPAPEDHSSTQLSEPPAPERQLILQ